MAGFSSGAQGGIGERALTAKLRNRNLTTPRNNRICVFGPSHAANHFMSASATGQPAQPSGSIIGPVNWANCLSGGRAVLDTGGAHGFNGDRTIADAGYPGMLSRLDAAIASGAGHIVMCAPTANDRNSMTAVQSIAALTTMIDRITAAGIFLTILTDYPHGSAARTDMRLQNTTAQPQIDAWQVVNRWLLGLNAERGVRVIDCTAILGDFTSGFGQGAAGVTYDGLHLSTLGAYMIGRVLAREWRKLYPPPGALPMGSAERQLQAGANAAPVLSLQPYFGGTTGTLGSGATGTLAADWTAPALTDGVTGTFSKVASAAFGGKSYADDGDGPLSKDWQQVVLGGTATASNEVVVLRQSVTCAIGDVLRACAEIEVDGGSTGLAGVTLYVYHNTSNTTVRQFQIPTVTATTPWPSAPVAGILRTPRWTADSASMLLQLAVRPITGQPLNATLRVRGMAVGKGL
ncbi:SGNH/GDSL hydrolase family protein [Sphingomonas hankookensis]|uniref:SGNH/GDSL hydrolase family protein n=1 Tax=Sphingomonas hankookensis TaxID=563996 RepID=UPI001F582275|nr:SGNH/GDSL hydrolase family protein [Sphingomonas hankookensis]